MNINIIKFGLIPIIIILVAFSYATLADGTGETDAAGYEIDTFQITLVPNQIVPSIEPSFDNVIAFDISNGQYTDDFSGFITDLQAMGYTVATIDIASDGIPENVVKLIISSAAGGSFLTEAYTTSEAMMIEQWVNDGGELLLLCEHGSSFGVLTEEICTQFGVTQNYDMVTDTDDYEVPYNHWVIYDGYNLNSLHPILEDVTSVEFLAGCTFNSMDGVIIRTDDDGTADPFDAPVAVAKEWGFGRVAIFGDYNWVADYSTDGYSKLDNSKMAINTILWLNDIQISPPSGATCTDLIAGQNYVVGSVCVWNDNYDMHVLYTTYNDWYLLETHLQVNKTEPEIPQNKPGNPIPGHFEFFESFDINDFVNQWYITFPIPGDMDYGDEIVVAAHAEVAHVLDGCMEVISDTTTQCMGLTSGKPWGDSEYAWEHPGWAAPKSEFVLGADWIWESEYVFDPLIDNWVLFLKEFEIPGLYAVNLNGEIKITCDNEYLWLYMNTLNLGTNGVWQTVMTYDVSSALKVGINTIDIYALNYALEGSTVTTNPAGLIYESEICYEVVDQEESAWGYGHPFNSNPKKNWGMYFDYIINTPPVAVISPEDESYPWCDQPVLFIGSGSYDPDGDPITYFWDFGDGTTSTEADPSHTYTTLDTFTVSLTVTDDQGAFNTTTTTVEIYNNPPVAAFHYDQPYSEWCEPIQFWDDSTDPDACDDLSYLWDFGDLSSSTEQNPIYTYSTWGTFTVTLYVTDGYGATDSTNIDVTVVNTPPIADFSPSSDYLSWCDQPVYFYDYSYDPDPCDDIIAWDWDFGDGSYSTEQEPDHTYTSTGIYNVELMVTDGAGEVDYYDMFIEIYNSEPDAYFYVDNSWKDWCDQPFYFTDDSWDDDFCDTLTYDWDFGDGSYSTDEDPDHSYTTPGSYLVILTVTDSEGASDTYDMYVDLINNEPDAEFWVDEYWKYYCDQPFYFTEDCYDWDECQTLTYYWEFGDGDTSTEADPSHTYTWPGTYYVGLTVTDPFGETDYYEDYVDVVNEQPIANFDVNYDWLDWCDQPFSFWDYSYDPDGCGSLTYDWDFGDGETSTDQEPHHTYDEVGTYDVYLTVTDSLGLFDTYSRSVTVSNNPPTADFDWSPFSPYEGDPVDFTDQSDAGDVCDYIHDWSWDFDDGEYSNDQNPTHIFTTAGIYDVELTVTDGYGDSDYWSIAIEIFEET